MNVIRMASESIYQVDTLDVSPGQKELAKRMARKIPGEIDHPEQLVERGLVNEWKPFPRYEVEWVEEDGEDYMKVPLDQVVGTDELNVTRMKPTRMKKALMLFHMEDYEKEPSHPPHLMKVKDTGEYFVGTDGNHRTLAHKILGLDYMYARVTYYEEVSRHERYH